MLLVDAQDVFERALAPLTVDQFLDEALAGGARTFAYDGKAPRLGLLGADPTTALATAVHLAPQLTWHSANPAGPPPSLDKVRDAADFRARIETFHARNYSVRFPDLRPLSPELDRLCRALEALLHQPVTASAFWSRAGMRAPVHYDDHDLIVIQLMGWKRWLISERPSRLPNPWRGVDGDAPDLGPHRIVDLHPGDMAYLPRGTFHTVDSEAESLHLALGFTPLTVREAVIAALDHLADSDAGLRATLSGRLAFQLTAGQVDAFAPPIAAAARRLSELAGQPGFLPSALLRRSSRAIADFEALPRPPRPPQLTLDTPLRRGTLAVCQLTASASTIDFSYPGGHLYIHRGAQDAVLFIVETPAFRVRDIPAGADDAVRLALAARFVEVGFLEIAAA